MRNVWILTRVLLKNTYKPIKKPESWQKQVLRILGIIALMICCLPMLWMIYGVFAALFQMGFTGVGIQTGLLMVTMIGLMTALFSFPTMFYFSEDTMALLPLPLKPRAIVMARLVVIYMSCLASVALFGLPLLAAYGVYVQKAGGLLLLLMEVLLCSFVIMLILGILTLLVMRFLPFFANKDRFNLIVGLLAIVFSLVISMGSSMMSSMETEADSQQMMLIMAAYLRNGGLIPMGMSFFFWLQPAAQVVAAFSWKPLLLSLAAPVVCTLVFFWLADRLYLPSVTAAMAARTPRRKEALRFDRRSYPRSAVLKELRLLIRTPAYLTNCVLSALLVPILLVLILILNPEMKTLGQLNLDFLSLPQMTAGAFVIGVYLMLFVGSLNAISATAISREGTAGIAFMKSIPVPMNEQLQAKVYPGVLFTLAGCLVVLIPFHMYLIYPVWLDVVYGIGCLLCSYLVNWAGLLCDGLRPKLVWENETAAVKNNYNLIFAMLISWALLAILVLPAWGFAVWMGLEQGVLGYALVLLVLVVGLNIVLDRYGPVLIDRKLSHLD